MAKIPFPDIPNVPGVSDIPVNVGNIIPGAVDLNVTNIISAVRSGSFLSAYQNLFGLKYGIFKDGRAILEVDTITEISVSNQSQISDFPVERGSFSSYNKVALPSTYALDMLKTNSLVGSDKTDVINTLQELLRPAKISYLLSVPAESADNNDVQFVDVVTPDKTYTGVQLESYNVTENTDEGLKLIINCTFIEVRQVNDIVEQDPALPDGAGEESLGEMVVRGFNEATEYVKSVAEAALNTIKGLL